MERVYPRWFFATMHGILIFCVGLLTLAAVLCVLPAGNTSSVHADILNMLLR